MAKQKRKSNRGDAYDGLFLLKLTVYLIMGSLWLKLHDGANVTVPIPLGLIFGVIIVSHEHFRTDRKIEYAVLLVAALVGFVAPFGLYVSY